MPKEHPTGIIQSRNSGADPPSSAKSQRVTASERIQELQIERLQAELWAILPSLTPEREF